MEINSTLGLAVAAGEDLAGLAGSDRLQPVLAIKDRSSGIIVAFRLRGIGAFTRCHSPSGGGSCTWLRR